MTRIESVMPNRLHMLLPIVAGALLFALAACEEQGTTETGEVPQEQQNQLDEAPSQ